MLAVFEVGAAATADAVQALVQRLGYANPDSSPNASRTLGLRVSDGDGGASAPNVLTITVTPEADGTPPAYPQDQVNTHFAGEQTGPAGLAKQAFPFPGRVGWRGVRCRSPDR